MLASCETSYVLIVVSNDKAPTQCEALCPGLQRMQLWVERSVASQRKRGWKAGGTRSHSGSPLGSALTLTFVLSTS